MGVERLRLVRDERKKAKEKSPALCDPIGQAPPKRLRRPPKKSDLASKHSLWNYGRESVRRQSRPVGCDAQWWARFQPHSESFGGAEVQTNRSIILSLSVP